MSLGAFLNEATATAGRRIAWLAGLAGVVGLVRLAAPTWLVVVVLVIGSLPLLLHIMASRIMANVLGAVAGSLNSREANRRTMGFALASASEEAVLVLAFVALLMWVIR